MTLPSSAALAVEQFLDAVATERNAVTSDVTIEMLSRHLAAAGLYRSCALLRSALTLTAADSPEGSGLLCRAAWETAMVGAYILLKREEALLELHAEQHRQESLLADRNGLTEPVKEVLRSQSEALQGAERQRLRAAGQTVDDDEPVRIRRFTIEAMSAELGPLMVAAGWDESANMSAFYDLYYRSHSAYDTHGVAALERYIEHHVDGTMGIHERPGGWIDPTSSLVLAALSISLVAGPIFDEFGIDRTELDLSQQALGVVAQQDADASLDAARAAGLPIE